jgi:IS5 family transposase
MSYQTSFADLDYNHKKRLTRREVFLNEMEQTVPWSKLVALIEPAYPTSGRRGRQPIPLASMLRIHCMQNWFSFSDRQMEDALYEIESVRRFAGFGSVTEALPDETTILNFRHLLEKQQLTPKLLETINGHLKEQGLLVSQGTMVDATIIHAPSSTKNKDKSRDPDMHQTRKGQQWYFGMKIHIGADVNSGAVHTVTTTAANVADINELPNLLRKDDRVIFADAGYTSDEYRRGARHLGLRGASMTSVNPARTCRPARKSAIANSPRFEHA